MAQQIPLDEHALIAASADGLRNVAPDVAMKRVAIVNVVFVGVPGEPGWVLIDAALPFTAGVIRDAARRRFGTAPPAAIVMTHGHFDHTGVLRTLADEWDVPVWAHALEAPFLDGRESYAPPDPAVGGGMMALLSPLFPRGPIDVGARLRILPADGSVPPMPGWQAVHTPGHAPGHTSFWREADRTLIAGDAFVTTAQESVYAAVTVEPELHGPPAYFTPDWDAARESVRRLAALRPARAVTGHGQPVEGPDFAAALDELAARFDEVARPAGR